MIEGDIKLRVGESDRRDVGGGIIRIGIKDRERIRVTTGDIVEIVGRKSTVATVWPLHPDQEGVIKMDGYTRKNARTSIGDYVTVRRAEIKVADSVTIAPTHSLSGSGTRSLTSEGALH